MKPYRNLSGDSGVSAFEHGPGWINVQFKEGATYEYTAAGVGRRHLSQMKRHADAGRGLSTYISRHPEVRDGYTRRINV